MIRTKLLPLAIALSLLAPTLASARVVEGVTPPSARDIKSGTPATPRRLPVPTMDETTTDSADSDTTDGEYTDLKQAILDGTGGGGGSMYMPPYYGGNGISVDVSTTKTVTPDTLSISGWCDAGINGSRANVKNALKKMFDQIKSAVGSDGKVRRTGGYNVSPYYDSMTGQMKADTFSGNLNIWVDVTNFSASQKIADALEDVGCSISWNVSLKDMQSVEYSVLDDLIARLNRRKEVFAKLLKKDLKDSDIVGASLSSWIDSWSSYDPDTNTATDTITLTVMYMPGTK